MMNISPAMGAVRQGFQDELLDRLVGNWSLTGTMGRRKLSQDVGAEWVLGHRFLKIDFKDSPSESSGAPYEATYYIGYDPSQSQYVCHLIDSFGASFSKTLGFGKRTDAGILFEFAYPDAFFENAFIWDRATDTWKMVLRYRNLEGKWVPFAEKNLRRRQSAR